VPHIERTITVQQPLEAVWDFMVDFTTTEQWDPPTVSTTLVSGDGGVGTVYRNVSKLLGHETEIEYTVAAVEPMTRFQLRGRTTAMELLDTMTFEQAGDAVSVTYRAEFHPQGAAHLIEPLLPPALKKIGDDAERSMRESLEAL
jgi:ligand-binding SRPBCC domain-containing protein